MEMFWCTDQICMDQSVNMVYLKNYQAVFTRDNDLSPENIESLDNQYTAVTVGLTGPTNGTCFLLLVVILL